MGQLIVSTTTKILLFIAATICVVSCASDHSSWDYANLGDDWTGVCVKGKRQSPIAVSLDRAVYDAKLPPITFNYPDEVSHGAVSNNGHTIVFALNQTLSKVSTISGGGLGATYQFHSLHFHWSQRDCEGSEHVVEYERSPLELHLVHFNTRYGSLKDAKSKSDGLAVIGILFYTAKNNEPTSKLGQFMSEEYAHPEVLDHLIQVRPDHQEERQVNMNKYIEDIKTSKYFRYLGSLTTPTCDESVTWTVMAHRVDIAETILAKFRLLEISARNGTHHPGHNYRALQKLNGRVVYTNDKHATGGASMPVLSTLAVLIPLPMLLWNKYF